MTIAEALNYGSSALQDNEVVEPRRESALLLSLALKRDRAYLIAHPEIELSYGDEQAFRKYIERRAGHEPFQYIANQQEFFGLDFRVTPDVLIPRPETEILVEKAIATIKGVPSPRFCEIGVGSGCISVTILKIVEAARGLATDISRPTIEIARLNAEKHGVADRLRLQVSDVFESVEPEGFNLVASNPPYVPARDISTLQPEVRDFEPVTALTDGSDGLSIVERLVRESPRYLKSGGSLLIEIGFNQGEAVSRMFSPDTWETVELLPDLQDIPRIVHAVRL
jgi:release factor glutamine methyltransferase